MSVHLFVDTSTFRLGVSGPSTGDIWVELDGVAFPARRWNDFVVVLLETLASAVLDLVRGAGDQRRVYFMDGPFELELTRGDDVNIGVVALEQGTLPRGVGAAALTSFMIEIIGASQDVVHACEEFGDSSHDMLRLKQIIPELRRAVSELA